MKKSVFASAALSLVFLMPTAAFANYYSYERCLNNGGGYFGCLGELMDVQIANPEVSKEFDFVSQHDKGAVVESIKAREGLCGRYAEKERAQCYLQGLRQDLILEARPGVFEAQAAPGRAIAVEPARIMPSIAARPGAVIETVPLK